MHLCVVYEYQKKRKKERKEIKKVGQTLATKLVIGLGYKLT